MLEIIHLKRLLLSRLLFRPLYCHTPLISIRFETTTISVSQYFRLLRCICVRMKQVDRGRNIGTHHGWIESIGELLPNFEAARLIPLSCSSNDCASRHAITMGLSAGRANDTIDFEVVGNRATSRSSYAFPLLRITDNETMSRRNIFPTDQVQYSRDTHRI